MELVRELGTKSWINGSGRMDSRKFGLFVCPVCNEEVEKSLSHGKRDKNCGNKECRKATLSYNYEAARNANLKHGFSQDPNFRTFERIYYSMHQRCENPKDKRYQSYGGRGITVDERWHTLEQFAKDMFPEYKKLADTSDGSKSTRPSIDRIDVNGNYSPDNCKWIKYGENSAKDKRIAVHRMDFDGNVIETYESMTVASEFTIPFGLLTMKATLSNIHDCCNGKRDNHLGYKWEFATDKIVMQNY